jgi:G:T-mismatch repair DNA endonuclease (very short patch repair protein)
MPRSNVEFWQNKFKRNVANDRKHIRELKKEGWQVLVVWECELKFPEKVLRKLRKKLDAVGGNIIEYPSAEPQSLPLAAEGRTDYGAE